MKKWLWLCAGLACVLPTHARELDLQKRVYVAQQVVGQAPEIDGRLSDDAWQRAVWSGEFTQRSPNDGAKPSQETAFKILYDARYLYVAIRAFDAEPERIERRLTRRDRIDGDWVGVQLDSYRDRRTAFSFAVSAAGVKRDAAISNDGEGGDSNWDPVWFVEVQVDSEGWTAEMKIPFSQLRYAHRTEQVWGLQVERSLFRKGERSLWQYIPRNAGGWVSYFGELRGIKAIAASRRVELLPYVVGDVQKFPPEPDNPFATGQRNRFAVGGDLKVGVTSDLTLDATVNPDFGQVEADPSVVNLTAFETFYEEKRPFFIEGQNILSYRVSAGDSPFGNDQLFYSRRIGRPPQAYPALASGEFADVPNNTSILTAVKLTGKTRTGLSVGLLDAVTARERAEIDLDGQRRFETVEPLTNYFVGRLQKDYNSGNTSIGGILTATHRKLSEAHLNFLNRAAYSGGFDFRHQWQDKTYYVDLRTAFSHIRGSERALLRAQTSSRRYFQRPDADYVRVDSSRTSMSGHGGFFSFGRGGNHNLRANFGVMWRSPGLELNDLGFLRQADRVLQWVWLSYRWTQPFSVFRSLRVNFNQWSGWNFGRENVFKGGNINGGGEFKNYWRFWLGINRGTAGLSTTDLRGGPALKQPGSWSHFFNLSSDNRKAIQFGFGGFNNWADEGGSRTHNVRFWLRFRPHDALQLRVNPFYTFNLQDLQYVSTKEHAGEPRYLFGRLNQKTLGITIRLDYSLTPDLSIQYYGQPFLSAGSYRAIKRITQPRAARYQDRFHVFTPEEISFNEARGVYEIDEDGNGEVDYTLSNPNFNFRQFRSNLVLRWEYRPGSTLFLVWTQERTGYDNAGDFSFGRDFDSLFTTDATNVFLVKVNRWFSL